MKKWIGVALGANWSSGAKNKTPKSQLLEAMEALKVLFPGESFSSSIIESEPMGPQDQPNFSNGAILLQSDESPERLLAILKGLEVCFGRRMRRRWGERELDLDLIFVEGEFRNSTQLKIPHPDAKFRTFVMDPMEECFSQCQTLFSQQNQISPKISDMLP